METEKFIREMQDDRHVASIIGSGINGNLQRTVNKPLQSNVASIIGSGINGNLV